MIDILLWGIGRQYNILKNTLSYFELSEQIHIAAIVANDAYMTELDKYDVIKPDLISKYKWDYIFVMSENSYNVIVDEANKKYGIPREKLISYRVLWIPLINLDEYISLKESNISIISNNCWGGMAYKTLGLKCLSPFRNLFVLDDDYLRLISDLNKYMCITPEFERYEIDPNSGMRYPVLRIEDVCIHCNHEKDYKKAIEDWERRKERINYDNLFFEMYTNNKRIANAFCHIIEDKRGICFVPWKTVDKHLLWLEAPNGKSFWEIVNANASLDAYGLKYSLIDLLQDKITLRYF